MDARNGIHREILFQKVSDGEPVSQSRSHSKSNAMQDAVLMDG